MKKKFVVLGLVGAMALGTCTVSAASGTRNISATFRNIKIVVDGKQVSTSAEPFIYNGTTYLPIRAVGEAVGKEVNWDAGTNTVYLGEVPASAKQQAPAPTTPEAPAASSDLPILTEYLGGSKEETLSFIAAIRTGEGYVDDIYKCYIDIMYAAISEDDPQRARAAYAEAQIAFSYAADSPNRAEMKAEFEAEYQNSILPEL